MDSGLAQDGVRKLREVIFDILNSIGPNNRFWCLWVRPPERGFVDPIRLLKHSLAKTERLEHLHGPTCDTVCLTKLERPEFLVNNPCGDLGKHGELRCQRQACGATADDEYVDLLVQIA